VILDQRNRTIRLAKPLILDLGAVAKGMAVDWAARELASLEGFVIDAGGDLFVKGFNEWGKPWRIGVRHPVNQKETIASFQLTDAAVCTSGSYERISPNRADTYHLIDPGTGRSRSNMLSCTVIAPFAMMADAFSTAAFLLGPQRGNELLKEVGLDGLWITSSLKMYHTEGMERYLYESNGISHSLSS
jgi:thiamine biosynthesis lipoprotein